MPERDRDDIESLIDRIVSGARIRSAAAREELRRELGTHFDEAGTSPEAVRDAIRRFGDERIVAGALEQVHRRQPAIVTTATFLRSKLAAMGAALSAAVVQDLPFGIRMLRRSPGASLLAILCLTLGIGANAAVFSWIEGILLRPFPLVVDQDRLFALTGTIRGSGRDAVSWPDFLDLRRNSSLVETFIAEKITGTTLNVGDRAERAPGSIVSANYFDAIGVRPILGRTFDPAEETGRAAHPVTVISYQTWQERFHGDPAVIGRTQRLNGVPHTIIGVTPEGFYGTFVGYAFQFWVPASMQPAFDAGVYKLEDRGERWLEGFVRLKPGVTQSQAQAELSAIATQLEKAYPDTNRGRGIRLYPLWQTPFNGASRMLPLLGIALAVVGAVLLIACANVGNLLLVRAFARQQEMTVRLAVGADRARLVRQLLAEGAILSAIAAIGGIVVATWLRDALVRLMSPRGGIPLRYAGQFDWRVLASCVVVCVAATLLFGLVPALMTSRVNLAGALRCESGTVIGGRGRARVRSALVLVQMSLSFVLLVGAVLLIQSMQAIQHASPGFSTEGVVTTWIDLFTAGYDAKRATIFQDALADRLQAVGGIQSVAFSRNTPFTLRSYSSASIAVDGYDTPPDQQPVVDYNQVGAGYFSTMGIPIMSGREFRRADDERSGPVAIVDETMAAQFWRGGDPVGRQMRMNGRLVSIVGVSRASRYRSLLETPAPFFYVPLRQNPSPVVGVQIRTTQSVAGLAPALAREIHALDAGVAPGELITMREQVTRTTEAQQIAVTILCVFGGLALVLAAIGLYGVLAASVAQSSRELALRMALGAGGRDLMRLTLSTGLTLTACGLMVGGLAALELTRLLGYMLYQVSPRNPLAFGAAGLIIGVTSMAACLTPAWRALRTDPVRALRE